MNDLFQPETATDYVLYTPHGWIELEARNDADAGAECHRRKLWTGTIYSFTYDVQDGRELERRVVGPHYDLKRIPRQVRTKKER